MQLKLKFITNFALYNSLIIDECSSLYGYQNYVMWACLLKHGALCDANVVLRYKSLSGMCCAARYWILWHGPILILYVYTFKWFHNRCNTMTKNWKATFDYDFSCFNYSSYIVIIPFQNASCWNGSTGCLSVLERCWSHHCNIWYSTFFNRSEKTVVISCIAQTNIS